MIVVSDTSPITNLGGIGRLELLQVLFETVVIPPEVMRELERGNEVVPPWVAVREVSDETRVRELEEQDELDRGEAEALVLAIELNADRVIIDERHGLEVAERLGLRYVGILGVLLEAKDRGYIEAVRPILDDLVQKTRFWLSEELRREVLRTAREADA